MYTCLSMRKSRFASALSYWFHSGCILRCARTKFTVLYVGPIAPRLWWDYLGYILNLNELVSKINYYE